jgi:hypothetical protein
MDYELAGTARATPTTFDRNAYLREQRHRQDQLYLIKSIERNHDVARTMGFVICANTSDISRAIGMTIGGRDGDVMGTAWSIAADRVAALIAVYAAVSDGM